MTPDELNTVVASIVTALDGQPGVDAISLGLQADNDGTLPEIYLNIGGEDVSLTVAPL